jgi:hypothetical protein
VPLASRHARYELLPCPLIWREPAFHSNAFFHRHSFFPHGTLKVHRT